MPLPLAVQKESLQFRNLMKSAVFDGLQYSLIIHGISRIEWILFLVVFIELYTETGTQQKFKKNIVFVFFLSKRN